MKTVLQGAASVALLALAICAIVITRDVHNVAMQTAHTLEGVNPILTDLRARSQQLAGAIDHVTAATSQLELASQEERTYWNKTSQESAKGMRDLRQLTARLDRSVNDHLIPDLDRGVLSTTVDMQNVLASFQHTSETLTARLNDPAISQIAEHVDAAAAGLELSSKNVADGTAHLDHATADIETAVHRLTRPPSLAKRIGMALLDVGAKLGSIAAGFVR
jgi:hypothetical protein